MKHGIWSLFAVVALTTTALEAQVASLPKVCDTGHIDLSPNELDSIARDYFSNDRETQKVLQNRIYALLATFATAQDNDKPKPKWGCDTAWDYRNKPVSIVLYTTLRSRNGEILRFFLNEPYRPVLHGELGFFEVFLASSSATTLTTGYTSTRKRHPIVEKLPAFAKEFQLASLGPLTLFEQDKLVRDLVVAQVSWIDLPFKRGIVTVKDEAAAQSQIPTRLFGNDSLVTRSKNLKAELELRQGKISECAKELGAELQRAIADKLDEWTTRANVPEVKPAIIDPTVQWSKLGKVVRTKADEVLKTFPACTSPPPSSVERALSLEAALEVESRFKALVAEPKPLKASASQTYQNVPLQWIGLAVMAGVITNAGDAERVKLEDGLLISDSVQGLTMASLAVNFHPVKYDPTDPKMTAARRWRLFAGAMFAPEFGLVGGVGCGIVQGLSVNAGAGFMRINAVRDGDGIGEPPTNPADPYDNKAATVYFAALGWNF